VENEITNLPNPTLNLSIPPVENKQDLIKGEQLTSYFKDIMEDIREDRFSIDGILTNFVDLVTNGGDATSSSKEALINLLKLKADMSDKKIKVVDLMSRIYLKEKDTFPKYLTANQHNEYNIVGNKRKILKDLQDEVSKNDQL
jgi:hypothetical protein